MANISDLISYNEGYNKIFRTAGTLGKKIGVKVYVVGGFVRDAIMGRENHDIDLMVEGDGIQFSKLLANELNVPDIVPFDDFGTAIIPHSEIEIEVATARKESYKSNSRKPEIELTTIDEDMSRRDFTVNAMAVSILPDSFGSLIDPYGGIQDISKKLIITPLDPNETFIDDPLRMLRAIRFSAQLNFNIAPNTINSIEANRKRLEIVSWERIRDEILKCLSTQKPSKAFYLFKETKLMEYIFPELDIMSGVDKIGGKGHKDVFIHTLEVVDNAANLTDRMKVRFAALVHDIAKPQTKRFDPVKGWTFHGHEEIGRRMIKDVAKRMKLSNELRDYLMVLTKLHLRPIALAKKTITDSAIRRVMFEAGEDLDDLMALCRADITTKNPEKVKKYMSNFNKVEELMRDVKLRDEMRAFHSPVRGEEIMKTFNLNQGPQVGAIKRSIENAILDGEIENSYQAALDYMMKLDIKSLQIND